MEKRDWLWGFLSFVFVTFVDQFTKYLCFSLKPEIHGSFYQIHLFFNKGAMLGAFSQLSPILRIVSLSTSGFFLLFSFIIFQYLLPTRSLVLRVGSSILMAGILGNVIDRTLWGYVIDFIVIGNQTLSTGVFNVADFLQWVGYFLVGYAFIVDPDNLWPKNNLRKTIWIHPKFQIRYCFVLVSCGVGFTLVFGVFSYTFLRFIVMDLTEQDAGVFAQLIAPYLITFSIISVSFFVFLLIIGLHLSHRIVGPIYAFERFVDRALSGEKQDAFKLRRGDELHQLESLAHRIIKHLTPPGKTLVQEQNKVDGARV